MSVTAVIGGIERALGAWKPSRLRLRAVKPSIELAALPAWHVISDFPTDYDQGGLSSCGPNSVAELYEHDLHAKFSRLFLYYFTRATEGDVDDDDGIEIPDMLAVAHTMGLPPEGEWDYDNQLLRRPPPPEVFADAFAHRVDRWDVLADLDHVLFEISNNRPVMFGFQVPRSAQGAETARTGVVTMPSSDADLIGGHCVNAIGYDRDRQLVKVTSHWGRQFGDAGCLWLPFAIFTQGYASDFTAIRSIT